MNSEYIGRFAPSPTGELHFGSLVAAVASYADAKYHNGSWLLRIDDLDQPRKAEGSSESIITALNAFGFKWDGPVRWQSQREGMYRKAIASLRERSLAYPCRCSRRQIEKTAQPGLEGMIYPGTCRALSDAERIERIAAGENHAWRFDVAEAARRVGDLTWIEEGQGIMAVDPLVGGDVVLARKDTPSSYHVAVTHDDQFQGITWITRGQDLYPSTHIHRLLQALMGWDAPAYRHHGLLVDEEGKRFAKRDRALTLRSLREAGKTPEQVLALAEKLAAQI